MNMRKVRAFQRGKYHGYGMEAPLSMLKENLLTSRRVELFPDERIAFLDIPFGELFHRCNDEEWDDFQRVLSVNRIPIEIRPWWRFWGR